MEDIVLFQKLSQVLRQFWADISSRKCSQSCLVHKTADTILDVAFFAKKVHFSIMVLDCKKGTEYKWVSEQTWRQRPRYCQAGLSPGGRIESIGGFGSCPWQLGRQLAPSDSHRPLAVLVCPRGSPREGLQSLYMLVSLSRRDSQTSGIIRQGFERGLRYFWGFCWGHITRWQDGTFVIFQRV